MVRGVAVADPSILIGHTQSPHRWGEQSSLPIVRLWPGLNCCRNNSDTEFHKIDIDLLSGVSYASEGRGKESAPGFGEVCYPQDIGGYAQGVLVPRN